MTGDAVDTSPIEVAPIPFTSEVFQELSDSALTSSESLATCLSNPSIEAPRRRSSAFVETGLGGSDAFIDAKLKKRDSRPRLQVRFKSELEIHEPEERGAHTGKEDSTPFQRVSFSDSFEAPSFPSPNMPRLFVLALLLAIVIPSLNNSPFLKAGVSPIGAKAGVIRTVPRSEISNLPEDVVRRDNSPTEICTRWSHQTAIVNNTLYMYGGRATTEQQQTSNTWNNDFVALDLSKSWQISSPSLTGLSQPSGPPPVANGYLWNSEDTLYLYGGEFSDNPVTSPVPFSGWAYDILSSSWSEQQNPETSPGTYSDGGNAPVQRAAEGAGITVPSLGRGFYFGGHLDGYTTAGWSQSIARVYLTSLLEFTFPGRTNPSVNNNQVAGAGGIYRNITQGGLQDTASFPERADGILVYIPGYGADGIILGLAGGTNATFTQMNIIDVYDIANSTWYKQSTSGKSPEIRVNPCAVTQVAADGSSVQVYMFGGQNLIPYGNQTQYSDMWILTIPSFTWIEVDTDNQSVPYGRAGHACNAWNGQMIVTGGYVGDQLSCDTPGIYVFNMSSLLWENEYTALDGGNYLNQQQSQEKDPTALSGSYDYQVPAAVQSVIGGHASGGATVTAPALSATQGPFATGKPDTYTVTQSGGAVVTETGSPSSGSGNSNQDSSDGHGGTNVAAIVAGVAAGIFAVLAAYLGFCTWVYRRQLTLYKNHVAMAQRTHLGQAGIIGAGIPAPGKGAASDSSNQKSSFSTHSNNSGKMSGTPSGSGSGSGTTPVARRTGTGYQQLGSNNPYNPQGNYGGNSTANSSTEDLMSGQEPSFLGVFLNPRRSLRVVNRD